MCRRPPAGASRRHRSSRASDVQAGAEAQLADDEAAPPGPGLGQAAAAQEHRPALGQAVDRGEIDVAEARASAARRRRHSSGVASIAAHGRAFMAQRRQVKRAAPEGGPSRNEMRARTYVGRSWCSWSRSWRPSAPDGACSPCRSASASVAMASASAAAAEPASVVVAVSATVVFSAAVFGRPAGRRRRRSGRRRRRRRRGAYAEFRRSCPWSP